LLRYGGDAASYFSTDVVPGSEASEAALKLVTQYSTKDRVPAEPSRTLFIAREQSYHGSTLGALDVSGHKARKALYEGILPGNMLLIPACNPYRNRELGQTDAQYVEWHKNNVVSRIQESDNKVAGMIIEPVVGAVSLTFSLPFWHHHSPWLCTDFQDCAHNAVGFGMRARSTRLSEDDQRCLRSIRHRAHL
jgi:adenosylmethionine-8-amino-7-oxononanoate aminotransferase